MPPNEEETLHQNNLWRESEKVFVLLLRSCATRSVWPSKMTKDFEIVPGSFEEVLMTKLRLSGCCKVNEIGIQMDNYLPSGERKRTDIKPLQTLVIMLRKSWLRKKVWGQFFISLTNFKPRLVGRSKLSCFLWTFLPISSSQKYRYGKQSDWFPLPYNNPKINEVNIRKFRFYHWVVI